MKKKLSIFAGIGALTFILVGASMSHMRGNLAGDVQTVQLGEGMSTQELALAETPHRVYVMTTLDQEELDFGKMANTDHLFDTTGQLQ